MGTIIENEPEQQLQHRLKHIAIHHDTYKELLSEGRYSDTMDTIIKRILLANRKYLQKQQEEGELVIS
jgi:hypothetical protein